jgi:hypothetical protein
MLPLLPCVKPGIHPAKSSAVIIDISVITKDRYFLYLKIIGAVNVSWIRNKKI